MRCIHVALLAALWVTTPSVASQLILTDANGSLGCSEVRGVHIGVLFPHRGIVFLATRSFPGGQEVGSIQNGRLVVEIPGFGPLRLASPEGTAGTPIWGLLDRTLEVGERSGCFGFGERRFSDVDDLKTYLHWFVRQVLDRLPRTAGEPAPAIWLAGRRVTFEVHSVGHRALELRGVEGSLLGFQPDGVPHRYYFQPFVLGPSGRHAAVRVSEKTGDFYGPGSITEIAFVVIHADEAIPVPTDPPIDLQLTAIEERVSFVN